MSTTLADGFFFDKPREGAPDFVRGRISIQADKAIALINTYKNEKGYVNLDLLKAKEGGKLYLTVDTYKKPESTETPVPPLDDSSIPF